MADDQANSDEGSDPTSDIKKQNPGEITTGDVSENSSSKTQDLARAERDDFDPDARQE